VSGALEHSEQVPTTAMEYHDRTNWTVGFYANRYQFDALDYPNGVIPANRTGDRHIAQ
jgi:hypothetical protein